MSELFHLDDFLDPVNPFEISGDEGYRDGQIGSQILIHEGEMPDLLDIDIVIIGCPENRGAALDISPEALSKIRHQFYSTFYWHKEVRLADLGNVKTGATLPDTYAALRTVVSELVSAHKTVVILGGSHDLTLGQYDAYRHLQRVIEAVGIDALVDLHMENPDRQYHFLMEMLTGEPNFIRHYNHLAFQSYYVNPLLLETMDKLRFDCYRLGVVKEHMDEMEPVFRNSHLVSIDLNALQHAASPASTLSPNGLDGSEMCSLVRFAGMSPHCSSLGIYGYQAEKDRDDLTARQVAQMLWYFIDGKAKGKTEAPIHERDNFFEFHTVFAEVETVFLQSKRTGRWWMQLPDHSYIACSYSDYKLACSNEIPERWLRAQERS